MLCWKSCSKTLHKGHEPFKTYLQTKGVEIDMAEVKRISDQVCTHGNVIVKSLMKTKHGTCLRTERTLIYDISGGILFKKNNCI